MELSKKHFQETLQNQTVAECLVIFSCPFLQESTINSNSEMVDVFLCMVFVAIKRNFKKMAHLLLIKPIGYQFTVFIFPLNNVTIRPQLSFGANYFSLNSPTCWKSINIFRISSINCHIKSYTFDLVDQRFEQSLRVSTEVRLN